MTGDFLEDLQCALDKERKSYAIVVMDSVSGDGEVRWCSESWKGDESFRGAVDEILDDVLLGEDEEWVYEDSDDDDDDDGDEWKITV